MSETITLADVKKNPAVAGLVKGANEQLKAMGYTEHGTRHAGIVAAMAKEIILKITNDEREAELAAIAGYIHDIGNAVNRRGHGEISGAMAFRILADMGMDIAEVAAICIEGMRPHAAELCLSGTGA